MVHFIEYIRVWYIYHSKAIFSSDQTYNDAPTLLTYS